MLGLRLRCTRPVVHAAAAASSHHCRPTKSLHQAPASPSAAGAALVAHRIRRPLVFDRKEKIAKLQERDEIFEAFQAACAAAGLRLRFLNGGCAAARAGDEPLLLAIGSSEAALERFPLLEGECQGKGEGGAADGGAAAVGKEAAAAAVAAPAAI